MGKRIFFALQTVKTGIRIKISFSTNLSTDCTTLGLTLQFQTSMAGCASGTTQLKPAVNYGRRRTLCPLTGSISPREPRVSSTVTPRATHRMASTTTSIPGLNLSLTTLLCMNFWRRYSLAKTVFCNDVTRKRVRMLSFWHLKKSAIVISLLSVYSRASAHNGGAEVEQELTKSGIFTPIPCSLFRVRQWPRAKWASKASTSITNIFWNT